MPMSERPTTPLTVPSTTRRRVRASMSYAERDLTSAVQSRKEPVTPTKSPTRAPSLRDKHKSQTRRALRDSALKLFARQGYDTTTIEEIAERAGVSTRTFFRYFPTKEDVLYHGERDWVQTVIDAYPTQPTLLNDLDAMRVTFEDLAPQLGRSRRSLALYQKAVDSSPTLRGSEQDHQMESTDILAQAIATRRGRTTPDEGCRLLAAIAMLTYRRAVSIWLNGSGTATLATVITKEFKLLAEQLSS
jgi:AcrR family transcriptional regulator